MQNRLRLQEFAAVTLSALLSVQVSLADPLHKSGPTGDYVHEGSGWIFPGIVTGLERVGAPYTIDGNNDVGAEYAGMVDGLRRTALVDIYYADSAASGAKLASAAANMQGGSGTGSAAELRSEARFAVDAHAGIAGTKLIFTGPGGSRSALYFFQTPEWVVTVRTDARATDAAATDALDEFVRALRWDTLGTDPGNLHGGP